MTDEEMMEEYYNSKFKSNESHFSKPCFCSKCGKEILRGKNCNTVNLIIDVHECGYVFCKKCKKELNDYANGKIADYERKLAERFVKGDNLDERINLWLNDIGGEESTVYQYNDDEQIKDMFLKALEYK
jgi:hypothetical protein